MSRLPPDFYAHWRPSPAAPVLQELAGPPPERWLQQVWRHQRLRREAFTLADGRPVRVLHPGFWNREAGPDFHDAVIQIGSDPPQHGDVEIDVSVAGWRGHGHARDPRYARVVLHVVWEPQDTPADPPTLALRPFLDSPLAELLPWLEDEAPDLLPDEVLGRCCAPLWDVPAEQLAELLKQAARVRFARKAGELSARARHGGWEQALWEGLLAALGYKHNTWPMRRLAELVAPGAETESVHAWTARLFGIAGLLPAQLPGGDSAPYLKSLWDAWWRERDRWREVALPGTVWRMAGIRPANHPQRRLALAAAWLAEGGLAVKLENWLARNPEPPAAAVALLRQLSPALPADDFWERHWTLRSPRLARPQVLLGEARTTDLAVNVVLPWLHARATAGHRQELVQRVERLYFGWPAGEDNAVLKLARARLFAGPTRRLPRTAAAQQGLLQIVRDFCQRADALCAGCRFPELVRTLPV